MAAPTPPQGDVEDPELAGEGKAEAEAEEEEAAAAAAEEDKDDKESNKSESESESEEEEEAWYSSGFFPAPKLLRSGEERDVSWSELFFDLVFVVVFARGGDIERANAELVHGPLWVQGMTTEQARLLFFYIYIYIYNYFLFAFCIEIQNRSEEVV